MRKTLKRAEKRSKRIMRTPVAPEGALVGHVVFKRVQEYRRERWIAYFGRRMVSIAGSVELIYTREKFCAMAYKILVKELMRGRYTPKRYYDNER